MGDTATREIFTESAVLLEQAANFELTAGRDPVALEILADAHRRWASQDLSECDRHGCLGNSIVMLCNAASGVRVVGDAIEKQERERVAASLEEQAEKARLTMFSRPENTKPTRPLSTARPAYLRIWSYFVFGSAALVLIATAVSVMTR